MPPKYDHISEIHDGHGNWSLLVGILRLWHVSDLTVSKLPYSLEMVLIDPEGKKIHATIRKTLIYKYESDLKEGCVFHISNFAVASNTGHYRTTRHQFNLNFQYATKVKRIENVVVPMNVFTFTPPAECFKDNFDMDYLVDLIGVLRGIGKEREYEKNGVKSKIIVIELDNNGFRFQITLFGSYVDELNSFIAGGESSNAVIAILFAKCKEFNGKPVLQNSIKTSKLLFNPDCAEADALKNSMSDSPDSPNLGLSQLQHSPTVHVDEDFLILTQGITIVALKDYNEESSFIVLGKVKCIIDDDQWYYMACRCNKKVYEDSDMYFCEKCNRHVVNVVPMFRLRLRIIDHTDSAIFVLFDREATILLNSSCAEFVDAMTMLPKSSTIPTVILDLIDKTFLFKVECLRKNGSRYERCYRVKRVCSDADIIEKFKLKHNFWEDVHLQEGLQGATVDSVIGVNNEDVAQDLLPKFAEAYANKGNLYFGADVVDLCSDPQDSPAIVKPCPFAVKDLATSTKTLLKKDIKIEKD